jgi:hypothetical protein
MCTYHYSTFNSRGRYACALNIPLPLYSSPLRTCTHQQVESAENRRVSQEAASNSAMQQMKARLDQLMNENT